MLKHPDKIYPGQVLRIPDIEPGLTRPARPASSASA